MTQLQTRRASIASSIGTLIEYYEFAVFGISAAFVFNKLYFSSLSPANATMVSLSTFAIAFLARPIGAIVIGHLGDRYGRKKMLIFTLTTMGVATVAIGILPTYSQIGMAAPIMLVSLRVVQGFALGGEMGGGVLMAMEHTPAEKQSFYGSWVQLGAPIGTLLANLTFLLVALLPDAAFMTWGWRIPFLLSAILIFMGYALRTSLNESPDFEELQRSKKITQNPLKEVLMHHRGAVLKVAGSTLIGGITIYLLTVYGLSHGEDNLGLERSSMLGIVIATLIVMAVLMPFSGALADRFGRKKVFVCGAIGMTLMATPWALLFGTGSTPKILLGYLLMGVAYTAVQGTAGVFFAEAFPAEVRYSGLSIGYTLGLVAGSSVAPLVATFLYDRFGSMNAIVVYMLAAGLISTWCAFSLRRHGALKTDPIVGNLPKRSSAAI